MRIPSAWRSAALKAVTPGRIAFRLDVGVIERQLADLDRVDRHTVGGRAPARRESVRG
ncbi:MAG TPA: hypothetical protein VGJ36_07575 [Gemmatimonadales bacterium]